MAGYREDVASEVSGIPGKAFGVCAGSSPVLEDGVDVGGPDKGNDDEEEVENEEDGSEKR